MSLQRACKILRTALRVCPGVGQGLQVGDTKVVGHLQLAQNDLTVAVDGEDVKAVLVLLELSKLVPENEQRFPDQVRVLDDPKLERQLVDAPLEGDRLQRDWHSLVYPEQARRERIHDLLVPDQIRAV